MTETTPLEEKWAQEFAAKAEAEAREALALAANEELAKKEHDERVDSIKNHLPNPTGWRARKAIGLSLAVMPVLG